MDGDSFKTPVNTSSRLRSSLRSTATKRDSFAAELERDPQLSTAKRQQRTQAFTSHMAHASLERQLVAAQTAKMDLESKLRERDVTIDRLEGDRRWLAEREKEEKAEKEKERAEREQEKRAYGQEMRALRNSLTALSEKHADLEDAHAELTRSSKRTIDAQRSQIAVLERQLSILEAELSETKNIADERSRTIEEIQNQMEDLSEAQANVSRQSMEEENWSVLREELHRQAHYLRSVEATNAKLTSEVMHLRERQTSVEVLREEKRGLEQKVKGVDELREQVVRLEAEVQAARREREEWASRAIQPSVPSQTPVSVTQSLSELRLIHAQLLEEHGVNLALLRRREAELAEANDRNNEAAETIAELQHESKRQKEKARRLEQAVALAEREAGFLKALNASYASEDAANGTANVDQAKEQQIKDLEALLEDYKLTTSALENEVEALSERPSAPQGPQYHDLKDQLEKEQQAVRDAQKALEESEKASTEQLDRIEELEQELFELKGEVGAGRHIPPGVRILSLKDNPAQQWADLRQAVMDRLKGENEALLKRLKELEASGAGTTSAAASSTPSEELVPRVSYESVQKEKADLEEVVKQKEKRLLRLQQVFTAKSAEFRDAIASIMGVKLAFYPNGQVRVTSQYDLNASFVFQPARKSKSAALDASAGAGASPGGARMQLVAQGEGGPQDLPQLMRNWVEQEQCIPCFLASVTLECYDKWKSDREMGLVE
ncbi:hypothetical protein DENSPDRAFT_867280 [Dentipellis sp. KUC8613]|nr:hypothetical protein DENSPDRAFT_867280 [Dentipellis sp. KUC8613]